MKQGDGKISMGRPSGNKCDYICIEIMDESSGIEFVEARIKYDDFAKLITGLSYVDCEIITRGLDLVGTVREHKEQKVFVPDGFGTYEKRAKQAVEIYNADGWEGRYEDALNHHKIIEHTEDGAWYNVVFIRHVDASITT